MIRFDLNLSCAGSRFDSVFIVTAELGDADVVDDQSDCDARDGARDGQRDSQLLRDSPAADRRERDLVVFSFLHDFEISSEKNEN